MRITFLSTSSLDYPSPRGRWFPLAQELCFEGHEIQLVLLHHMMDKLAPKQRKQLHGGVMVYYASQMHVYGPVGQRRYFGPAELLKVSLLAALRLGWLAARLPSDVIHVCKPQPINGLAGLLAARATGRQLYVDCDDYEAGGNRFGAQWQQQLVRFWEDWLPRQAAGVTVNTEFLYQRNQALGVTDDRLVHVPNGISPQRLQAPDPRQVAGLRSSLGLGDAPVAVYVGTISQNTHNVGLLVDAFAEVIQHIPKARLLLVGDGEDRIAIRDQIAQLGLTQHVIMAGSVSAEQVPLFFSLGHCSIDPVSDDEVARGRSPLKIVESMALGIPVVTGDVGDRRTMLGGRGGMLVEPGSASALAKGIIELLGNSEKQQQLSEGARKQAELYRWDKLAKRWYSIYKSE
jgi:glycosyltransferase involved in cell wall biosynthesis